MRALHHSVVLKRKLSRKAKLSVFKSIFVPILTSGHEYWVMTEKVRSQMEASEMRFLRKIEGVAMFDKLRNTAILIFRNRVATTPGRKIPGLMVWRCKQNASETAFQPNFICWREWEEASWTGTNMMTLLFRESCLEPFETVRNFIQAKCFGGSRGVAA